MNEDSSSSAPQQEPSPAPKAEFRLAELSRTSFTIVLGTSLGVFFGLNPDWRELDITQADANILWSYVPIPPLVLLCLAVERKFSLASFGIETLRLALIKFAITYLFANVLWAVNGPPDATLREEVPAQHSRQPDVHTPRAAPEATPIDPDHTRTLGGILMDATGAPASGAALWVSDGLEDFHFKVPDQELIFENGGSGYLPEVALVQTYRSIQFRTTDGSLHTAKAWDEHGSLVFNYPTPPSGGRMVMFDRPLGLLRIECSVHGAAEGETHAIVSSSPFAAITDAGGAFRFEGVPGQALTISAWRADLGKIAAEVTPAQEVLELRWP